MKLPEGLIEEDFNWTDIDVIGTALLLQGGSIDSYGNAINPMIYYKVGKHKTSRMVCLFPTDRNMKHEFHNSILKKQGKFN